MSLTRVTVTCSPARRTTWLSLSDEGLLAGRRRGPATRELRLESRRHAGKGRGARRSECRSGEGPARRLRRMAQPGRARGPFGRRDPPREGRRPCPRDPPPAPRARRTRSRPPPRSGSCASRHRLRTLTRREVPAGGTSRNRGRRAARRGDPCLAKCGVAGSRLVLEPPQGLLRLLADHGVGGGGLPVPSGLVPSPTASADTLGPRSPSTGDSSGWPPRRRAGRSFPRRTLASAVPQGPIDTACPPRKGPARSEDERHAHEDRWSEDGHSEA